MTLSRKLTAAALSASLALASFTAPALSHKAKAKYDQGGRYSQSYCERYARKVAKKRAPAGGVIAGTAVGAGMGFILGRIIGGNNRSGAVGAVAGGAGGMALTGIHTSKKYQRTYREAYNYCRSR